MKISLDVKGKYTEVLNYIKNYLKYDNLAQGFVWTNVNNFRNKSLVGQPAGTICKNGYRIITINKKRYYAHRLIWFWYYGYMSENQIDHINHDKLNNRIENLREVSQTCNNRNCLVHKTNTSGIKGVSWNKQKKCWDAYITINNKKYSICRDKDFDEVVLHRLAAEQCLGWLDCDKSSRAFIHKQKIVGAGRCHA